MDWWYSNPNFIYSLLWEDVLDSLGELGELRILGS